MPKIIKKHGKTALILGLILVLIGFYYLAPLVKAGTISSYKDTLSDSRPSTASNHTIQFTVASAVDEGDTITATFDSGFDTSTIVEDDVDITDDGVDLTTAADCTGTEQASVAMASDVLTITICSGDGGTIAASSVVVIEIGNHASASGTGSNRITNPTAGTASIAIAGTFGDTGTIKVAIITGVTVTATVAESLTFTIAGVTNANCDTDTATLAGPDTDATLVAFGSLSSTNTFYHACQDLTLGTNATNGYAITVQEQTNLMSGSDTIDDSQGDTPAMTESVSDTWATATNNGFASSCVNKTGTDCAFTYANYRQFACMGSAAQCDPGSGGETAQTIMSNAGPVSSNQSRIEYKVSIGATQEAGSYSGTIVYIATPTY